MTDPVVTQADEQADAGERFGRLFREHQAQQYGCSGPIECTYMTDGNCHCFNAVLAQHRTQALLEGERAGMEKAARIADDEITLIFSQTTNGHGSNTARRIRDTIRKWAAAIRNTGATK